MRELAAWDAGKPYAEPSLLDFAAKQIGHPMDRAAVLHFSLPVPAWVYPVWIATAAALTLVAARRSVGWRFTATAIAAGYLVWRCALWPLFAVTGFPHSAVPFVVLAVGLAVDVACLVQLAWPAEAAVGAVLVTGATYLALYLQDQAGAAPPVSYSSALWAAPSLAVGWACWAASASRCSSPAPTSPARVASAGSTLGPWGRGPHRDGCPRPGGRGVMPRGAGREPWPGARRPRRGPGRC